MPLYENGKYHPLFIGDMHPVKLMDGNKVVFEPNVSELSGEGLSVNKTYNDSAFVRINGKTVEIGEGEKSPDNPYELKSVGDDGGFDLVSEGAGQLQTVHIPYTLRSLPDGTCDYIEIDNAAKTAKLVRNVGEAILNGSNEVWSNPSEYTTTYRLICNNWCVDKNVLLSTANSGLAVSADGDYAIIPSPAGTGADIRSICFYSNNWLYIRVEKEKVDAMEGGTVLDKFKNYLNLYPVTLIYQLAEPEITPIECEDVKTYYPYTNIYTTATVQPTFEAKIRVWEVT